MLDLPRPAYAFALLVMITAAPLAAKDSLGVYAGWAAFRDSKGPLCYAIAKAETNARSRDFTPYATISNWPTQKLRGQFHIRLSRKLAARPGISLRVGTRSFSLTGGDGDAWARDTAMDAAIIAAIRSASSMTVYASDARGRRFSDVYLLQGAATAIDAATLACSKATR